MSQCPKKKKKADNKENKNNFLNVVLFFFFSPPPPSLPQQFLCFTTEHKYSHTLKYSNVETVNRLKL